MRSLERYKGASFCWLTYLQLSVQLFSCNVILCLFQVFNLIKPIATVKKLFISLSLASDLPEFAIGDEKRLMQTILNVVGNAVKFSKEGSILISAFVAKPDSVRDPRAQDNFPMPADSNHFYLQVQVGKCLTGRCYILYMLLIYYFFKCR